MSNACYPVCHECSAGGWQQLSLMWGSDLRMLPRALLMIGSKHVGGAMASATIVALSKLV
eukprot:6845336-Karenia_brevis.AAC.1